MVVEERAVELPEDRRRAVFMALVAAQDLGIAVRPSRALVAKEQRVTVAQVEVIEREGVDRQWPPLDESS